MAWAILVCAGLLEIVWATTLKQSEGLSKLWPSIIGIGVAVVSLVLLSISLKYLPAGTGYAVWVSIGVVGVAIAGIIAFNEPVSAAKIGFLAIIVVGVVGLKLVEG